MPGRLGPRFALEAVFLIALAIAMGLADLTPTAIVVVMAVAWLLVAIVEWLASRGAEPPPGWSDGAYRPHAGWGVGPPEPETQLVPPPPPAVEAPPVEAQEAPVADPAPDDAPSEEPAATDGAEPAATGGRGRFGLRRRG